MYQPLNPIVGRPGFYLAFATATFEQSRDALREAIQTSIVAKAAGPSCGRCDGRGYTKQDGRIGCEVCHGIGVIV